MWLTSYKMFIRPRIYVTYCGNTLYHNVFILSALYFMALLILSVNIKPHSSSAQHWSDYKVVFFLIVFQLEVILLSVSFLPGPISLIFAT